MTEINESGFNILNDPLYEINKITLKAYGRWPYQSRRVQGVVLFTAMFGVLTVVIPEVIFFAGNIKKRDMNKIVDCIPNLIFTYAAYLMIFNSIFNYHKMEKTLFKIKDDWMELKDAEEINIFRSYAEEGKLVILIYLIATSATLILFCLEPLTPFALDLIFPLNESRPVRTILEVEYFVDMRKYYIPIYLHNLQAAYFVIFTVLTFDFYFIMVVQHACSMFARLSFAELIEDTLTVSWILQLSLNMIVISFVGVQTITRTNELMSLLKYAMTTGSVIIRLFLVSWPGQKIVDHSYQIFEDVCNLPWYNFPKKSKNSLILMMLRSCSPCYISAGKMIYLNFETYGALMRTSMSFFTMILSTQ